MRGYDVEAAFAAPQGSWTPVSPRLATARRSLLLIAIVPLAIGGVVLGFVGLATVWIVLYAVVALAVLVWAWWIIGRRVGSFGYAERADDLLVVSGILVRRLVIVPYGRMQLVDLRAGPIDRSLGITTVQLHTAAATTDATIPGLLPDEAAALRDRLAARGEERSAGL
ncbi:MAG: PH domain-containing protein [Candidatus Nanopelagicales bacterium]|jgi:membrane protein YdbS with pleckstrin-like domain